MDPKPGEWFCADCERIVTDAIELDLETCLKCGEHLSYEMDEWPAYSGDSGESYRRQMIDAGRGHLLRDTD